MPLYTIAHRINLSDSQKDALAEHVTNIHATMFGAPKLFVNVHFVPANTSAYVAGRRSVNNHILANVRHGPSRTQEMYADLCRQIENAWDEVVGGGGRGGSGGSKANGDGANGVKGAEGEKELKGIIILGDIVAGWENGFAIPEAGKDKEWLKENWAEFRRLAGEGREEWKGLVEDVEARGLL